jgi:hypothetical protein
VSLTPELAETLAQITSFPALLQAIHDARHTGRVVIDFYCGVPQQVELPQPPPAPLRVALGKKRPATPAAKPRTRSSGD